MNLLSKLTVSFIIMLTLCSCSRIVIKDVNLERDVVNDWPMYGNNPQRTNKYSQSIKLPLELIWCEKTTAAVEKSILAIDSVIYFGTLNERLSAIHIGTKKKVGKKKIDFPATCAYYNNHLIVARRYGNNTLYNLNLINGKTNWKINAGDIESEPLVVDNNIIITALYNHIDSYEFDTGTKLWTFKTDDQIRSSPAIIKNTLIFGCDDGNVYAIDKNNGKLLWKFATEASVQATPAIDIQNNYVLIGSSDFNFYALSIKYGTEIWRFQTNGQILNGAAIKNNKVIFGSTDNNVYCVDIQSGELYWNFTANSVVSTSPIISGDIVFWGSLDHNFYANNINNGKLLWKYKAKGRIRTTPVVWCNYFIGASENNYLYVFRTEEDVIESD